MRFFVKLGPNSQLQSSVNILHFTKVGLRATEFVNLKKCIKENKNEEKMFYIS